MVSTVYERQISAVVMAYCRFGVLLVPIQVKEFKDVIGKTAIFYLSS